jgi:hypothetical protein
VAGTVPLATMVAVPPSAGYPRRLTWRDDGESAREASPERLDGRLVTGGTPTSRETTLPWQPEQRKDSVREK